MKHFALLTWVCLAVFSVKAQTRISRYVIASTGNYVDVNGFSLSSTTGEPLSATLSGSDMILTQGFQQPVTEVPMLNLHIYNAFSPNNDDVNDFWLIDGIEQYKDNSVLIFNRWGILVWEGEHYDNVNIVWDGNNMEGNLLPSSTYYYLIKTPNTKTLSGWVQLLK